MSKSSSVPRTKREQETIGKLEKLKPGGYIHPIVADLPIYRRLAARGEVQGYDFNYRETDAWASFAFRLKEPQQS